MPPGFTKEAGVSSYAPSEEWETASKEADTSQEFVWLPTSPLVRHALNCPNAGINVLYKGKTWLRHECTGCNWFWTVFR